MDFVTKISSCRHKIGGWRKNNPSYGKDRINALQRLLKEVQSNDTRTHEAIMNVLKKLQEAYKDDKKYWHQKSQNMWYTS